MTSDDLTTEQARQLGAVIGRQLRYLGKLRQRMTVMSFPPTDRICMDVDAAYKALHGLSVRLHYLSVPSGVGRPAKA